MPLLPPNGPPPVAPAVTKITKPSPTTGPEVEGWERGEEINRRAQQNNEDVARRAAEQKAADVEKINRRFAGDTKSEGK